MAIYATRRATPHWEAIRNTRPPETEEWHVFDRETGIRVGRVIRLSDGGHWRTWSHVGTPITFDDRDDAFEFAFREWAMASAVD